MKKGPGRPNLGKTETIRQRAITVYLPTKEMVEKWKAEADKHDMSLSNFVTEIVDDAMRKKSVGMTSREELEKKLNEALSGLKILKAKAESDDAALKRNDETIADYRRRLERTVPETIDPDVVSRIVFAFMEKPRILVEKIPEKVGIDMNDREGMAKVREALDFLRAAGLVENRLFDWRWKPVAHYKRRAPLEIRMLRHKRKHH